MCDAVATPFAQTVHAVRWWFARAATISHGNIKSLATPWQALTQGMYVCLKACLLCVLLLACLVLLCHAGHDGADDQPDGVGDQGQLQD